MFPGSRKKSSATAEKKPKNSKETQSSALTNSGKNSSSQPANKNSRTIRKSKTTKGMGIGDKKDLL